MKKIVRIAVVFTVIAALFAACKAHERCPAYGKVNNTQSNRGIAG